MKSLASLSLLNPAVEPVSVSSVGVGGAGSLSTFPLGFGLSFSTFGVVTT
ncbi:MAG: hypothetical protein LBJ80_04000 [Rickettsiales bacterium]|nr:hypothetical protein [Rickettsiales bacterium]MDR1261552.1 hypothetical protein [Rickettsiales bacterium]